MCSLRDNLFIEFFLRFTMKVKKNSLPSWKLEYTISAWFSTFQMSLLIFFSNTIGFYSLSSFCIGRYRCAWKGSDLKDGWYPVPLGMLSFDNSVLVLSLGLSWSTLSTKLALISLFFSFGQQQNILSHKTTDYFWYLALYALHVSPKKYNLEYRSQHSWSCKVAEDCTHIRMPEVPEQEEADNDDQDAHNFVSESSSHQSCQQCNRVPRESKSIFRCW